VPFDSAVRGALDADREFGGNALRALRLPDGGLAHTTCGTELRLGSEKRDGGLNEGSCGHGAGQNHYGC
jgi:hypothetical protein